MRSVTLNGKIQFYVKDTGEFIYNRESPNIWIWKQDDDQVYNLDYYGSIKCVFGVLDDGRKAVRFKTKSGIEDLIYVIWDDQRNLSKINLITKKRIK